MENRPKIYNYRGPLLIHAGLSTKWLATWDGPQPTGQKMPFGALVGIVDVVMCMHIISVQNAPDDSVLGWVKHHRHASGPFCLVLKRPRRFVEPIPYRGNQGLFDVPPEVYTEQPFVGSLCALRPRRELFRRNAAVAEFSCRRPGRTAGRRRSLAKIAEEQARMNSHGQTDSHAERRREGEGPARFEIDPDEIPFQAFSHNILRALERDRCSGPVEMLKRAVMLLETAAAIMLRGGGGRRFSFAEMDENHQADDAAAWSAMASAGQLHFSGVSLRASAPLRETPSPGEPLGHDGQR